MQEYIWVIEGEQLKELQTGGIGKRIESNSSFYLRIPDHGKVPLTLYMLRKQAGSQYASIGFNWGWTSFALDGRWSIAVDELEYFKNNMQFSAARRSKNSWVFDDNLIGT